MNGNTLLEFEEQNWDWLAEKFIKAHQDDWEQFVEDEFNKTPDEDMLRDR